MSEMVSDILDYSQLQAGYLQLRRDWYNLAEIVESEVLLCEQSAAEHGITLRLEAQEKEIAAYVDALKISHVVRNLLYNALNHTKDGLEITVEIEKKDGKSTILQAHGMEYGVDCRDGLNIFWFRYSEKEAGRRQPARKE